MEATNETENQLFSRNTSDNISQSRNSTSKEYVFAPVSYRVRLTIFTAMLSFGVYGFVANSLILYFKHKKHRRRRRVMQRAFSRCLTEYFVNSLALSDLLCCLISLPLMIADLFVDYITNNSMCRFVRFLNTIFPVITILNLLVIGVERYLCIFYPYQFLSREKAKRMVVGAWIVGFLITLLTVPTYRLVYFGNIEGDVYTLICKYDSSVPLYRALFTSFLSISYIIPSIFLTFINLRILKRLRSTIHVGTAQNAQRNASRFKVTRMFVSLIFAFVLPYLAFVTYSSIATALKLNEVFTFTEDYIVRYFSLFLVYGNATVSATILIRYEKLYLDFLSCFSKPSIGNDERQENDQVQGRVDAGEENEDTPV